MASVGRDALTECKEMRKRTRTYKAGTDGCGAGVGRVTTTSHAPRDDGYAARDDGSALPNDGSPARDDGSVVPDDGSAACDDGSTAHDDEWQRATTGTEVLKKSGDDGYATLDDGYRVGRRRLRLRNDGSRVRRRRVRPRVDASPLQYIRVAD